MTKNLLVKMQFGSQVYGTSVPTSDVDYKSVSIPDPKSILLQSAYRATHDQSKLDPTAKNTAGDIDIEDFSLHHFMKLLMEGQTVTIDMLFVPSEFYKTVTPNWEFIVANRDSFISSKTEAFIDYCRTQANKYGIKGSRMSSAKNAVDLLKKLPYNHRLEQHKPALDLLVADNEFIEWEHITNPSSKAIIPHFSVCGRKVPLTIRVDKALETYNLLYENYGLRARQAMNNEGIDWKATMHAVRIIQQAKELRATKFITFPRPNAHELLEIRQGKWHFDRVRELIENGVYELDSTPTILEAAPDKELAEDIVLSIYASTVSSFERDYFEH